MDTFEHKKCVICYDDITNKKKLLKICNCVDSLLCEECLQICNEKKIKKCPVCKKNLKYNKERFIFYNFFIYIKKNKLLIFNIITNLILINLVIYLKYYKNSNYPTLKNKDIFFFYHQIKLKNYINFTKYFYYYKTTYFLIINIFNLVIYPISYIYVNIAISNINIQIIPYITKYNKIQLYINIGTQLLSIFIFLISNNYFIYLQLYLLLITILYSMTTIICLFVFSIIILFENYKYIRNYYMISNSNIKVQSIEEYQDETLENNYLSHSSV